MLSSLYFVPGIGARYYFLACFETQVEAMQSSGEPRYRNKRIVDLVFVNAAKTLFVISIENNFSLINILNIAYRNSGSFDDCPIS